MKLPEGRLCPRSHHRYVGGNGRPQAAEHVKQHEWPLAVDHRPCASRRHQDPPTGPCDQKRNREKDREATGHGISGLADFKAEYRACLSNEFVEKVRKWQFLLDAVRCNVGIGGWRGGTGLAPAMAVTPKNRHLDVEPDSPAFPLPKNAVMCL